MEVKDPGHCYLLNYLDAKQGDENQGLLTFVKRVGDKYPGNTYGHAGTNMQEVLRALIDRVKYLNNQIPDSHNDEVIMHLRESIEALEIRAAIRHNRLDKWYRTIQWENIEDMPTCKKCGHIGCEGECH